MSVGQNHVTTKAFLHCYSYTMITCSAAGGYRSRQTWFDSEYPSNSLYGDDTLVKSIVHLYRHTMTVLST